MFESLKKSWESFNSDEPGCRFQNQYERRTESGQGRWKKFLYVGGGIIVLAAGIFFLPAPGPGMVIVFAGAAMIAQGSLVAARALDWCDVRIRRLLKWALAFWSGASMPVKAVLVVIGLIVAAAAAYGAYWFFFLR
ncbi:MAG: PGPGW domain-containing protein [Gemmatimonadetes bacterium]|nr:PGPGW domain-containing protein [Gemmatimonadota bacterium]